MMGWVTGALLLALMIEALFGVLVLLSLAMKARSRLRSGVKRGFRY